jgi:5S rRNA maturation endonuclease (ribonuclease M5)
MREIMKIVDDLIHRGFTLKRKTANEFAGPCPWCNGVDRFIVSEKDGKEFFWCRQCKKSGDYITLLRELDDLTFEEAARKAGEEYKIKNPHPGNGGKKQAPPKEYQKQIVATYNYTDEKGATLYQVVRYDPKDFRQRRPGKTKDWVWNLQGIRLVLYNLPEVIERKGVFFVEGEKDADELTRIGIPATCNPMGAGKLDKQVEEHDILAPLHGKMVYILPDNDAPGKAHAESLANKLHGFASTLKIIPIPGLQEKEDVSDFILNEGEQKARQILIDLAKTYPSWRPPSDFMSINDLLAIEDDQYSPIIEGGIMPVQSHILIAGESGVGKSLLRLELAIHIAMGWEWIESWKIPQKRRVLICQWENPDITEKKRVLTMCRGLDMDPSDLEGRIQFLPRYKRFNLSLKGDIQKLHDTIEKSKCEVICYDCLSNMHQEKSENDNAGMRKICDAISDVNAIYGTSCILIHHFSKPSKENQTPNKYRVRGAQAISDWAFTIAVYSDKPARGKTVLRELEITKVRDGIVPRVPYTLKRDEHLLLNPVDAYIRCTPEEIVGIMKDVFNGVATKTKQLEDEVMYLAECGRRTAEGCIKNAVKLGYLSRIRKGRNVEIHLPE